MGGARYTALELLAGSIAQVLRRRRSWWRGHLGCCGQDLDGPKDIRGEVGWGAIGVRRHGIARAGPDPCLVDT